MAIFLYNLNMNYYEEKLEELQKLIGNDKQKALELINEELKMPYIPEKYEAQFIALADELEFELRGDAKVTQLTREEILEYLFSNDKVKVAAAIDSLRDQNIRTYLNDVERWLFINADDSIGQAIIFEILVEQQIDKNISFGDTVLNPVKTGDLMSQKEIKKAFEVIINSEEQPQIQESAIQELQFYILKTFPNFPKDGKTLAIDLMDIIKSLLNNENQFDGKKLEIYNIIKQK